MASKKIFILAALLIFIASSSEGVSKVKEEAIRFRIRGYQLQHQGHLEEAIELYRQAIASDPSYAAPHNDLGVIFEEKGELEGAEKEYLEALRINPSYLDAYSNLAILYEKTEQHEKMIEALKKGFPWGRQMMSEPRRREISWSHSTSPSSLAPPNLFRRFAPDE